MNFDTELEGRQTLPLAWAIKDIAEGMAERRAMSAIHHSTRAIKHLNEFINELAGVPELTDVEANTCIALHTYMRKGMDCHLGSMLWLLVNEGRGNAIWYAFVKGLVANKGNYELAIREADRCYRSGHETSEDLIMLSSLHLWKEDFENGVWKEIGGRNA